jgi:hypothetical protein
MPRPTANTLLALASALALGVAAGCGSPGTETPEADAGREADAAPDARDDAAREDARPDVEPDAEPEAEEDDGGVEDGRPDREDAGREDAGREDARIEADFADLPCPDPDAGFDPDAPGIQMMFNVASVLMMGMPVETAMGAFLPGAREDFAAREEWEVPLDECVAGSEPPIHECDTNADCAPEQECRPETDASGNPIEGSGVCTTPREPLDVGTFDATGFAEGVTLTFTYNPGSNGAYTASADGTLPSGTLGYDTDYVFQGAGDPEEGLGPFAGTVEFPAQIEVTAPPLVPGPMGYDILEIDPTADLALEWSGGDAAAEGTVTLTLSGRSGAVTCRARDDGTFTIPGETVASVGLGDMAFLNILELRRERRGIVCGEGITSGDIATIQSLLLNVKKRTP